jgi:hypothetical protein
MGPLWVSLGSTLINGFQFLLVINNYYNISIINRNSDKPARIGIENIRFKKCLTDYQLLIITHDKMTFNFRFFQYRLWISRFNLIFGYQQLLVVNDCYKIEFQLHGDSS